MITFEPYCNDIQHLYTDEKNKVAPGTSYKLTSRLSDLYYSFPPGEYRVKWYYQIEHKNGAVTLYPSEYLDFYIN